jgi:hypothetical protein
MDRENIPSSKQNESQISIPSKGKPSGNGVSDGTMAKKEVKTRRRRRKNFWKEVRLAIKGIRTEVWVAMIGAIATIITTIVVTLPTILPLVPWILPSPTLASALTSTTIMAFITETAIPSTFTSLTSTPTPTIFLSPADTVTPISSATPVVTTESTTTTKVFVKLVANRNTGRPPLNVRFDARDSYLLEPDGRQLSCRGGPCFYSWNVYSGGQQIGNAENNSIGTFEHTFGSNGTYTVTVFVCRGRDKIDCAGSGAQIVVSR